MYLGMDTFLFFKKNVFSFIRRVKYGEIISEKKKLKEGRRRE